MPLPPYVSFKLEFQRGSSALSSGHQSPTTNHQQAYTQPPHKSPFVITVNGGVGGQVTDRHSFNTGANIAQVHAVPNGNGPSSGGGGIKASDNDPNQIVEVESDDSPPYLPAAASEKASTPRQ